MAMRGIGLMAVVSVLACKGGEAGPVTESALANSHFFCRATVVPNASTNGSINTKGGDPIYFYSECFPSEARCRSRGTDECFEQPVAFCYEENVLGSADKVYTLCLSSAHVCDDWRKTRMRDMGDRVKSGCEMITSAQFIE